MTSVKITLPDALREWVENQVASGQFSSTSDYLRELIRQDRERRQKLSVLQKAIRDGVADAEAGRVLDGPKAIGSLRRRLSDGAV